MRKKINKIHKKSVGAMVVGRFFSCLGLLILLLLGLILGAFTIICYGPSQSARDLFVSTMMETSALKFVPKMYYSSNEITAILAKNATVDTEEITNVDLITIPDKTQENKSSEQKDIEIIDISSTTYKGKIMLVKDPSRVVVATPPSYGEESQGRQISELVEAENAVAGINAGGFIDNNGAGNGGQPSGIVIKNGKLLSGGGTSYVIGFDTENKLVLGMMTPQKALEMGVRDAVSFGPIFIVNGKRTEVSGSGGGLNPRTCIGQRADGTVLLLVIDGRQATSLGATYDDCINIMEEYGAVNAANLDGGSSTMLFYEGKIVNECASVYGPRKIPTAFVVK